MSETTSTVEEDFDESFMDLNSTSGVDHTRAEREAAKARASSGRTDALKIGEGESVFVRFIHDMNPGQSKYGAWANVLMHSRIPTKPAPADLPKDKSWPQFMFAVCRKDKVFNGKFQDCYICDTMRKKDGKKYYPYIRTFTLLAIREPVRENGKLVGYKTAMRTWESEDGTKHEAPDIRYAMQGYDNFYGPIAGLGVFYDTTVLNRDYRITREGTDKATTYRPAPCDPIMCDHPKSGEKVILDLRDDDIMDKEFPKLPSLAKIIYDMAKDDFYQRWFIPGETTGRTAADSPAVASPSNDVPSEDIEAMRARMRDRVRVNNVGPEVGAEEESKPEGQESTESNAAAEGEPSGLRAY